MRRPVQVLLAVSAALVLFSALTHGSITQPPGDSGGSALAPASAFAQSSSGYNWNWSLSDSRIELGDSVSLEVRVYNITGGFDHGGVSISFPSLTSRTGHSSEHRSTQGDVTRGRASGGVDDIAFYERGDGVFSSSGARESAEHLLVESHNSSWSQSSDRTVRLWITPNQTGRFEIRVRTWFCEDGWNDCVRGPSNPDTNDQQGWGVKRLTIDVSAGTSGEPDLDIEDSPTVDDDPSPSEFTVGDTVTLRVSVRNIGSAPAGITRLAYFIGRTSGHRFDTDSVGSLDPDEYDRESARYTFTDDDVGTQYFVLEADHDHEVEEPDEINNTAVIGPFEVVSEQPSNVATIVHPPSIISVGCSPIAVETGQTVSCRPNLGGGSPSHYLWAALGGHPEGARSTTFSTSWTTPGNRRILLEVCNDGGCVMGEQDILAVEPSAPVLFISPSTYDFGTVVRGDTPEKTFHVTNAGSGSLEWWVHSWPHWVEIPGVRASEVGDGTVVVRVRNDALLDSLTGRIAIRSNGGDHSITLSADIVAPAMPDLVVDRLAVNGDRSPTRFTVGDTVDIRVSVTNIGGGSAGASQLEYQIGGSVRGQPFGTDRVRSLGPNKTSDKSHRYTFTEGDVGIRQFRLIADRDSVVDEQDESNNVRLTDPFEVVPLSLPDLVVQGVTFNGSPQPDDFTIGDTVAIRVRVGNIGSGNAAGYELVYHIGGSFQDWVIDTDSVRSLRPRMTTEESTTYTFTQDDIGTRHFRLVVDHHSEIDEQDESNNAHISSPFRVAAPRANVAPTASRVSPSQRIISRPLGSTQTFRAQGADPDANISSITWLVEGRVESGLSLDLTGSVTRSFAHTFNDAGDYLVQAVFTDANGESDSVIWDVEVPLPPRIVSPGCFPEEVETGEEVSCSATLAGGPPSRYLWASIGGNPQGGEAPTFSTHWDSPGDKQVILKVCNDGGCDSSMKTVVVEAPVTPADLRFYSSGQIVIGSSIEVKGSGFPSSAHVDILELGSISLLKGLKRTTDGDGQFTIAVSVPTLQPGSYALVARVGDTTARNSITIEESPLSNPCQSVHRDSPEDEVLEFRAGGTQIFYAGINARCGHVESIQWNINGEELSRTPLRRRDLDLFEHTFDGPGDFKVEVVVFHSDGRFTRTHWDVRVGPPPIEMGPHDVRQGPVLRVRRQSGCLPGVRETGPHPSCETYRPDGHG